MKIRSVVRSLLFIAGFMLTISLARSPAAHAAAPYDPGIVYKGPYESARLYYQNDDPVGRKWIHGGDEVNHFPETVSCREARLELRLHGVWRGPLNGDGSCGAKDAPVARLALGNWLNYMASIVVN